MAKELIHAPEHSFREVRRLHQRYASGKDGRLNIWIAPAAIWCSTDEALRGCKELADELGIGITTHIAETLFEVDDSKSRFRCTELEALERMGILGPNLLAVHCVYLNNHDIRLARARGVKVSHNAISNMYLSSGIAPVPRMLEAGITVGLGVDGPASNNNQDMLQLVKTTALLHKVAHGDIIGNHS